MTHSNFTEFMAKFVPAAYGAGKAWAIEMTTKKSKTAVYPHEDSYNRYTLIIIDPATKEVIATSDELKGYNKSVWNSGEHGKFVGSLKPVK